MKYVTGMVLALCVAGNVQASSSVDKALQQGAATNKLLTEVLIALSQPKDTAPLNYDKRSTCIYDNRLYTEGSLIEVKEKLLSCSGANGIRNAAWFEEKEGK